MNKSAMLRIILFILGIVLVAVGIIVGNYMDVFHKAIRICYECVGIG